MVDEPTPPGIRQRQAHAASPVTPSAPTAIAAPADSASVGSTPLVAQTDCPTKAPSNPNSTPTATPSTESMPDESTESTPDESTESTPPESTQSTPPESTVPETQPHPPTNSPSTSPQPSIPTSAEPVASLYKFIPFAYRKRVTVAALLLSLAVFIRKGLGIRIPLIWFIQGIHYVRHGENGSFFECYVSPFQIWIGIFAISQFMLRRPQRT
eukprot:GFKZ01011596.1.p2 GENE.GFKZ01011596.1~~GFKZ01011596.1.p2  ORF type:complete len:212 (+),score=14.37 GFKZ01011596.1:119-754(+)